MARVGNRQYRINITGQQEYSDDGGFSWFPEVGSTGLTISAGSTSTGGWTGANWHVINSQGNVEELSKCCKEKINTNKNKKYCSLCNQEQIEKFGGDSAPLYNTSHINLGNNYYTDESI